MALHRYIVCFLWMTNLLLMGCRNQDTGGRTTSAFLMKEEGRLVGHTSSVQSVVFDPSGRMVLSAGGRDHTVRLWNVTGFQQMACKDLACRCVCSAIFSPADPSLICVAGYMDRKAVLLFLRITDDGKALEEEYRFSFGEDDPGEALSAAFSPNGEQLLCGFFDRTVRLFDVATKKELQRFAGKDSGAFPVSFSPDAKLAMCAGNSTIHLWDLSTGGEVGSLKGHESAIPWVVFVPPGDTILSGSWDQTVRLWDTKTGQERGRLVGHSKGVHAVAVSPDGQLAASGDVGAGFGEAAVRAIAQGADECTIRLWNLPGRKQVAQVCQPHNKILRLSFSPDGKRLASAGSDGIIYLWRVGQSGMAPVPEESSTTSRPSR